MAVGKNELSIQFQDCKRIEDLWYLKTVPRLTISQMDKPSGNLVSSWIPFELLTL